MIYLQPMPILSAKRVQETIKRSPNAIYVILTNPLDAMAYLTMKLTKLPPTKG